MSASSKKKLRREQEESMLTEKQRSEKKEATKLKAYTIGVCAMIVVVLLAFIGIIIANSGIIQRNITAMQTGDHKISSVDLNYAYIDTINNFMQESGSYAALFGLDTSKPLDEQVQNQETGETWADYFLNQAAANLKSTYALYDAAKAEGYTMTEEESATINTTLSNLSLYAQYSQFSSANAYLKALYGTGSNEKTYRNYLEAQALATSYYNAHQESLTYTDEDVRAAEAENFNAYSSFSFNTYEVRASAFLEGGTKDDEGNTTYSDEEKAASVDAAKAAADALAKADSVEAFDKAIAEMEINKDKETPASSNAFDETLYKNVSASYRDWVSDSSRKAGDTTVIANTSTDADGNETTNGYTVLYYVGSNDNAFPLINVRHILVSFEGGTKDSTGKTTYSDEEKAAAKTKAEELLEQWKNGDATEDSFAALATENTTDTGSKDNGGLYEEVIPGQMVTNFNDWCFDESRKPGDTGIVESDYGYHVMYFVGDSETIYRDYMIRADLTTKDQEEWYTSLVDAVTMTMKNTGLIRKDLVMSTSSAS